VGLLPPPSFGYGSVPHRAVARRHDAAGAFAMLLAQAVPFIRALLDLAPSPREGLPAYLDAIRQSFGGILMWHFLRRLASRRPAEHSARLQLETLEGRQLLSVSPVSGSVVGSYQRSVLVGDMWRTELGVARFDPQTGHEEKLFRKVSDGGMYHSESIG